MQKNNYFCFVLLKMQTTINTSKKIAKNNWVTFSLFTFLIAQRSLVSKFSASTTIPKLPWPNTFPNLNHVVEHLLLTFFYSKKLHFAWIAYKKMKATWRIIIVLIKSFGPSRAGQPMAHALNVVHFMISGGVLHRVAQRQNLGLHCVTEWNLNRCLES